jgi:hypothetical protein
MCSGEWNFSSGSDHSDWEQLAFIVRENDKPVDYVFCMIPSSEYEVIDDWHVLGMRATSSKTVRCKDVFVPQHRVVSMKVRPDGGYDWPGLEVNRSPMYRIPVSAIGGNGLAGCLIGALSYFVLFGWLAAAVNPALTDWNRNTPITVTADPANCHFSLFPQWPGTVQGDCDTSKGLLASRGFDTTRTVHVHALSNEGGFLLMQ